MSKDMDRVSIKKDVFYEMVFRCVQESPLEACGCLSGAGEIIEKIHTMPPFKDTAAALDPSEIFRIAGKIQTAGHKWLGVFRAHAADNRPTRVDIDYSAEPDVIQFIIALSEEGMPTVKAYRIESGRINEIRIEIE